MATLTVNTVDRDGVDEAAALAAAAAGGDEFSNDGKRTFFVVENEAGVGRTVTFVTQKTVDGEAIADKDVVTADGERYIVGPFPASIYNDDNGRVQVTYSSETGLSVAAFKL